MKFPCLTFLVGLCLAVAVAEFQAGRILGDMEDMQVKASIYYFKSKSGMIASYNRGHMKSFNSALNNIKDLSEQFLDVFQAESESGEKNFLQRLYAKNSKFFRTLPTNLVSVVVSRDKDSQRDFVEVIKFGNARYQFYSSGNLSVALSLSQLLTEEFNPFAKLFPEGVAPVNLITKARVALEKRMFLVFGSRRFWEAVENEDLSTFFVEGEELQEIANKLITHACVSAFSAFAGELLNKEQKKMICDSGKVPQLGGDMVAIVGYFESPKEESANEESQSCFANQTSKRPLPQHSRVKRTKRRSRSIKSRKRRLFFISQESDQSKETRERDRERTHHPVAATDRSKEIREKSQEKTCL